MPLHYVAQRGDLASFILLFAATAPTLTPGAGGLGGPGLLCMLSTCVTSS